MAFLVKVFPRVLQAYQSYQVYLAYQAYQVYPEYQACLCEIIEKAPHKTREMTHWYHVLSGHNLLEKLEL